MPDDQDIQQSQLLAGFTQYLETGDKPVHPAVTVVPTAESNTGNTFNYSPAQISVAGKLLTAYVAQFSSKAYTSVLPEKYEKPGKLEDITISPQETPIFLNMTNYTNLLVPKEEYKENQLTSIEKKYPKPTKIKEEPLEEKLSLQYIPSSGIMIFKKDEL